MHIPDGFLSTPVWATMDAVALPAVGLLSRRAQRKVDTARLPLMGVMGAFIFAAQMINFPVGNGTSSHLVGGALLSFTLGPAAATMVLTAILALQALVFQDGGLLAFGTNVFNMAIAGVFIAYLPYLLLRGKKTGIFLGGMLSLLASAALALGELALSGVRMPRPMLMISAAVFAISAVAEGAITLVVMDALERIEPGLLYQPQMQPGKLAMLALSGVSALLACGAAFIASARPDGIERITLSAPGAAHSRLFEMLAGLAGAIAIFVICTVLGRLLRASRSGLRPEGV